MEKRQRYELYAAILDFCSQPRKMWFLVRKVNSNFQHMGDLLSALMMAGLLEESEEGYKTTELGINWLEAWEEVTSYGL